MGFIWTLIIGLIAGALAKLIIPGRQGGGIIVTMLLGVVGAFVATWLGQALGWYAPGEGAGLIGAVVGAIIVLLIWGALRGRRNV
ncbi:GlsB/YeaQ/YmgE family stress response membrane protein [Rubellimicrobium arenae]|uniref:GlsB/YeaQ/YmgE family stress response membrane protein n=1 Tax=Rubellimicrobium arenae TaxID=2817372 RepID=UPI001B312320|nr:GlsB/YeaQ/YmgE family stress response membrane protein [Rubellimicrobium arenae]